MKKDLAPLSRIVEKINKRFGTAFRPEDQVANLRKIAAKVADNETLRHFARQDDMPNLEMVYNKAFTEGLLEVAISNSQFFGRFQSQDDIDYLGGEMKGEILKMLRGR